MLTASDSLEYDQSLLFGEENISGEKKKEEKKKGFDASAPHRTLGLSSAKSTTFCAPYTIKR